MQFKNSFGILVDEELISSENKVTQEKCYDVKVSEPMIESKNYKS